MNAVGIDVSKGKKEWSLIPETIWGDCILSF